jgi:hypothetical protein
MPCVPTMGLLPCSTQGGCVALQSVFGTAVQVTLSGEVWNVTVELRVPVVERVTLQFTHGVLPEMFDWAVWVASVVKVKVNEQSGLFCAASGRHVKTAQRIRRVKGMALRSVVMPTLYGDFRPVGSPTPLRRSVGRSRLGGQRSPGRS